MAANIIQNTRTVTEQEINNDRYNQEKYQEATYNSLQEMKETILDL